MDERFIEQAERLAEAQVRDGIERAQTRNGPPPGFDGTCDCGTDIPQKRVELGYYRCLDCQRKTELLARWSR